MCFSDNHIVETYKSLLKGLSVSNKRELIKSLTKSLKDNQKSKEEKFFKSFGALAPKKSMKKLLSYKD